MRYHQKLIRLLSILVLLHSTRAYGQDLLIVNTSSSCDHLDSQTVTLLFLGKKRHFPSGELADIIIRSGGPIHDVFLHDYLEETSSQFDQYWKHLVFTGRGRTPTAVTSDEQAIAAVQNSQSAIAYIDALTPHDGVRVIQISK